MGAGNNGGNLKPLPDSDHPPAHEHSYYLPAIVEAIWIDACEENGWGDIDDLSNRDLPVCFSVGYLVKDLESHVAIMQTMSPHNGNGADCMYIPRPTLRSLRVIEPWRTLISEEG